MAVFLTCPDSHDLERLAQGQLSESEAEQLGRHILECSSCASRLSVLQEADPLVALIHLASPGQSEPDNPAVKALVERFIRHGPESADGTASSGFATETAKPPVTDEPMPARIGRYLVTGRLGAGGMGVVWQAHDPHLGRDVAIKMPSFQGAAATDAAARQRFLREARAAAAVRHANICPIYDVGEDQGRPHVVMALVEGESLAGRLRRQGRFEDPREAVALILRVAEALAAVHAAQIVHRDLKPANILLDRAGQPYLADFGLARADDGEQLTAMGQVMGTPAYMAPEQANPDLGPVSPASDQYSLGVVLYQMLTARLPFEGSATALLFQIGTKPVPPPSQYRAGLNDKLERLVLRALARLPQERFSSVANFANALRGWWEGSAAPPPPRPKVEAQNRRVTLLSCGCDLFDSEAIQAALDPEEQHDLLLDFQQLCREVATPLTGTVVKTTDRGVLICFGIPFALECAARRAVRTGLSLLDRMAALNARLGKQHKGLHLSARIAIHSDRAVVTDNRSPGEALAIVGQVLPVVDQLEYLAPPDFVVLSDDTHRLLRGFVRCTCLGTYQLKGAAGAKPIYRVDRQSAPDIRGDGAGPSGLVPLIGRDRETALLEDRWEQAVEGVNQVVLLAGEAGIGKSRQVRVLKEHVMGQHAQGRAAMIIEWPCILLTQNSSLFHAQEYFEGVMDLDPNDDSSRKLDKLTAYLDHLHLASAEAVALFASLLSIPLDGRYPSLSMSPLRQKEKTLDLLLEWLRTLAQRQPVLFVIEDVHWAGPTTLEFLELIVEQMRGTQLLTLLTFRPEFVPPWKQRDHQTQVSLRRLNRRQTGELMLLKSGLPTIPQSVLEEVVGRTDGVPLFVEEFTAMLLEAGGLRVVDGAVQIADSFNLSAIPAGLQDLLMARLEKMASNLDIVQLAAAIGREFSYELLAAVAACSDESLQQELAKLVDAELLFQHGRPPSARYQFKHALIQDTAYQAMLKKKRQQFHARIAEVLEQRFPEICAAQPELLAHHFGEGQLCAKAIEYCTRAGDRAQQRGAYLEAIDQFRRAVDLVHTLPETRERHYQEVQLHISCCMALQATKGYIAPEVEAHYARAHALSVQCGCTSQTFRVVYGLFRYSLLQAKFSRAHELATELLAIADQERKPELVVGALRALGTTSAWFGKHGDVRQYLEKAIAVPAAPELRTISQGYDVIDPWIASQVYLSWALWYLGYPEQAAKLGQKTMNAAEGLNNSFTLAYALSYLAWLRQFGLDWEAGRASAARGLALANEKGLTALVGWAKILHDCALAQSNPSEQVVGDIRRGIVNLQDQGHTAGRSYFLTSVAQACARIGRLKEGLTALAEAQEFADATGERIWQPELHRLKGELLLQRDPTSFHDAEACFHQALDVARRQQARSLELRAAMSLARLWVTLGKTKAAEELLAPVYASFTEGFQTHDLQTARALLEECRSKLQAVQAPSTPTPLIGQDTEAHRLYLAARYYLEKRTEEGHRKSIATYVQILDKDPTFALAWAGLAFAYHLLSARGYASPTNACPKGKSAAMRALALDKSLAEACTVLATILMEYDWDLAGAEQAFRRALELKPDDAAAHQLYGKCLACLGRHSEAIAELRRAQDLDPLSAILSSSLGRHGFFLARMYDQAVRQYQRTLETDPTFWLTHRYLGWAYLFQGKMAEAVTEFAAARQLNDDSGILAGLGYAYAASGQQAKAQEALDALTELAKRRYVSPDDQTIIHIGLGDKDQAFSWLEKAVADRSEWGCRIRVDPVLDPLRADPRFDALLKRMNIKL